jgi:hypothetical protein
MYTFAQSELFARRHHGPATHEGPRRHRRVCTMAISKRDARAAAHSGSADAYFRLVLQLDDGRRKRSVTLDYDTRATIEQQLRQVQRERSVVAELYEFRNERGEMLAVVARALADYEILAMRGEAAPRV